MHDGTKQHRASQHPTRARAAGHRRDAEGRLRRGRLGGIVGLTVGAAVWVVGTVGVGGTPAGAQSPLGQAIMPNFAPAYDLTDGTAATTPSTAARPNNLNFLTVYPVAGGYQFQLGFQQPYAPDPTLTAFVLVHPVEGEPYRFASELDGDARLERLTGDPGQAPALGPWEVDDTVTVTAELVDGRPSFTVTSEATGLTPDDDLQFGWTSTGADGTGWIQVGAPVNLGAMAAQAEPDTIRFARRATEFMNGLPLGWRVRDMGEPGRMVLDRSAGTVAIELPGETDGLDGFITLGSALDFEHLVLWNYVTGPPGDPEWTAYEGTQIPSTEVGPVAVEIADGTITIPLEGLDGLFPGEDGNGLTVRAQILVPSGEAAPNEASPTTKGRMRPVVHHATGGPLAGQLDFGLQTPVVPYSVLTNQRPQMVTPPPDEEVGGDTDQAGSPITPGARAPSLPSTSSGSDGVPPWAWAAGGSALLIGGGLALHWYQAQEKAPVLVIQDPTAAEAITQSPWFTPAKCSEEYIRRLKEQLGFVRGELDAIADGLDGYVKAAVKIIEANSLIPEGVRIPDSSSAQLMELASKWSAAHKRWQEAAKPMDGLIAKLEECGLVVNHAELPIMPPPTFGDALDFELEDEEDLPAGPLVPVGPVAGLIRRPDGEPGVPGLEDEPEWSDGPKLPFPMVIAPGAPAPVTATEESRPEDSGPDVPGLEDEEHTEDVMPAASGETVTYDGDALKAGGLGGLVHTSPDLIVQENLATGGPPLPDGVYDGDAAHAGGLFGQPPGDSVEALAERAGLGVDPDQPADAPMQVGDPDAPTFQPKAPPPDDGQVM